MDRAEIIKQIEEIGIVPVVRAASADEAMRAIDAIMEGGINVLEITMTVPGAVKVIEEVVTRYGSDVLVGAGTVLDPETARACILAGSQFVVSPALNLETIAMCRRYGVPICPGALTPTEVITAWTAGGDFVKIFPCGSMGGASYLKNLKGPLPQVKMIPTGGVNLETTPEFLKAGACAVAVGGELIDAKTIAEGRYEVFEERARQFMAVVKKTRAEMKG